MQRLVIECSVHDVATLLREPTLEKIKSMEVLSFLKNSPDDMALVCRIQFKDPSAKIEEVLVGRYGELQVLEKDKGAFICFFRARGRHHGAPELVEGVYTSPPYEINDGRLTATLLGNGKEIREFMNSIEKTGIQYKVVSIMDAKFSPDSPLGLLTEKQRKVILSALNLGYYDFPRRVSSEQLAKRLSITEPTLVMHRRKAERILLKSIVES